MSETAVQEKFSTLTTRKECKDKLIEIDSQCDLLEGIIFNTHCEVERRKYINQFLDLKEDRRLLNIQKSKVEDPYKTFR